MRIVSWNCAGAYRDKIQKIIELKPDIAVIQECESLDALRESREDKIPQKSLWFSDIERNKGVGIFIYDDSEILSIFFLTSSLKRLHL